MHDPASGGTSVTWYDGWRSPNIVCYGVSGVSGTTAYPGSITLNTGTLPSGATQATSTTSSPACTTSTSGSGATEEYILTCPIADTPTSAQNGTYTDTFTANPGTDGRNATTSGTLTLTVQSPNTACTAPAAGGTSTTFTDGTASSYTVICYSQGYSAVEPRQLPGLDRHRVGDAPLRRHLCDVADQLARLHHGAPPGSGTARSTSLSARSARPRRPRTTAPIT